MNSIVHIKGGHIEAILGVSAGEGGKIKSVQNSFRAASILLTLHYRLQRIGIGTISASQFPTAISELHVRTLYQMSRRAGISTIYTTYKWNRYKIYPPCPRYFVPISHYRRRSNNSCPRGDRSRLAIDFGIRGSGTPLPYLLLT